ncbi:MAG: 3-methylcrotonyl-CoA carboxylase [Gammaproteobacteria bacterium]|nr:MAG: 3-methylcrotonyl-CoA carboxylase [Gammaproteobacteria bacterium]
MFNKLLIANRGEIACRVIHTAREMGITTVAVYSDADQRALHVELADEAVYLGPAAAKDSYLRSDLILQIAKDTGAQAIHPGYGFLSENADFARQCKEAGVVFVGPSAEAISAMGSKSNAKVIMENAGVPLVPGYHGDDQSPQTLKKAADDMGYPVLLKATAGGGGKGMRQVEHSDAFDDALAAAKREALASFGDDDMLVEKYLTQPRHVEVQVFCDSLGNGVYLAERDCSLQRRHQKVIEEAPAPGLSDALRVQMGEAAVQAAKAINYCGAGTVEFLLDKTGEFYFMEMNTRLQVEHPVTEMITGQDLVKWQLQVAAGEPLPLAQEQITTNGHAFEARIYAEDPANDFLPATGTLHFLRPPAPSVHVRVDTGVREGDEISVHYDPMIAKLIVWDENRERALARLARSLTEYRIGGTVTNIDFLYRLASAQPFIDLDLDTRFIERHHELIFKADDSGDKLLCFAALAVLLNRYKKPLKHIANDPFSPWQEHNAWRLNKLHMHKLTLNYKGSELAAQILQDGDNYQVTINDVTQTISVTEGSQGWHFTQDGHRQTVQLASGDEHCTLYCGPQHITFEEVLPDTGEHALGDNANALCAPMNGTIVALLAEPGQSVEKGTPLLLMEAMKMEHSINAPEDGSVGEFFYQPGELVDGGAPLLDFQAAAE